MISENEKKCVRIYAFIQEYIFSFVALVQSWQAPLRKNPRRFFVMLFICGAFVGASVKIIARESIMIGYNDYMIISDEEFLRNVE